MLTLTRSQAAALGYDLDHEVKTYKQALLDHRYTVDIPAPTAPDLVEHIVRQHGGIFRIDPDPVPGEEPPVPMLLLRAVMARIVNDDEYDAFEDALKTIPKADARLFDQDGHMAVASPNYNTLVRTLSKRLGDERADQILAPAQVRHDRV